MERAGAHRQASPRPTTGSPGFSSATGKNYNCAEDAPEGRAPRQGRNPRLTGTLGAPGGKMSPCAATLAQVLL
jgi:hypothetical protein